MKKFTKLGVLAAVALVAIAMGTLAGCASGPAGLPLDEVKLSGTWAEQDKMGPLWVDKLLGYKVTFGPGDAVVFEDPVLGKLEGTYTINPVMVNAPDFPPGTFVEALLHANSGVLGAIEGAASAAFGDQNATRYSFYLPVGEKGKQLWGSGISKSGYVKFAQKKK
jgi:hypothetical protein